MQSKNFPLSFLLLCVILSIIAGIVGGFMLQVFFPFEQVPISNVSWLPIFSDNKPKLLSPSDQEKMIGKVLNQIQQGVVALYRKNPRQTTGIYLQNERLGCGFALTSDGWLVTEKSILGNLRKEEVIVKINEKFSPVEKIVIDPATSVIFLKVAGQNLSVLALGNSQELNLGQTLLVPAEKSAILAVTQQLGYQEKRTAQDFIESSEIFSKFFLVSNAHEELVGCPALNLQGEAVGILAGVFEGQAGKIIPIDYVQRAVQSLLKKGAAERVLLGVQYQDLGRLFKEEQQRGALVKNISRKSPAELTGLQVGDIILKVENEEVGRGRNLTEIIQEYPPGTEVNLLIKRAGEEMKKVVKLGTF